MKPAPFLEPNLARHATVTKIIITKHANGVFHCIRARKSGGELILNFKSLDEVFTWLKNHEAVEAKIKPT